MPKLHNNPQQTSAFSYNHLQLATPWQLEQEKTIFSAVLLFLKVCICALVCVIFCILMYVMWQDQFETILFLDGTDATCTSFAQKAP